MSEQYLWGKGEQKSFFRVASSTIRWIEWQEAETSLHTNQWAVTFELHVFGGREQTEKQQPSDRGFLNRKYQVYIIIPP